MTVQLFANKLTADKIAKVKQVSDALNINHNWLLAVMYFESGKTSWRGNFSINNDIKKEGNSAAKIISETKNWEGIDQEFSVPSNAKSITISGWLKSENIIQGENPWNNGLLNVEFTSDGKNKTAQDESIAFVTGSTDWQFYSKTFTLPQNTQRTRIMIAIGFATGILYADDFQVKFNP